jgi:uncharacterized protein YjbI with pentapeptide repeats
VARAARTKPNKTGPDRPDLPAGLRPAPAHLDPEDTWDGVLAGPDLEVPEHVADLTLQECRWEGVDLSGRSLGGLRCRDTEFRHCDLSGAVLEDATLRRVSFVDCRLTGAVLAGAQLTDVHVRDCRADLVNLRMAKARFLLVEGTGLQGADLYRFTAAESWLLRCDLTGANLADAVLTGTDLHGTAVADVRGALSLSGARISADQLVPMGAAVLAALGIVVTDPPAG